MAVHLQNLTLVSDDQILTMRRWVEAAMLAYEAGSTLDGRENLVRLDAYIRGFTDPAAERVDLKFSYGQARLADVKL